MGLFCLTPVQSQLYFWGLGNWIILDYGTAIQTIFNDYFLAMVHPGKLPAKFITEGIIINV